MTDLGTPDEEAVAVTEGRWVVSPIQAMGEREAWICASGGPFGFVRVAAGMSEVDAEHIVTLHNAHLAAQRPAADGWRLVPTVITAGMHNALTDLLVDREPQASWDHVLAAAPPAPFTDTGAAQAAEVERLREALERAQCWLYDDDGTPIADEETRALVKTALNGSAAS